jgi:hypothetical protein
MDKTVLPPVDVDDDPSEYIGPTAPWELVPGTPPPSAQPKHVKGVAPQQPTANKKPKQQTPKTIKGPLPGSQGKQNPPNPPQPVLVVPKSYAANLEMTFDVPDEVINCITVSCILPRHSL